MKQPKCTSCINKFRCLAEHFIPENMGEDCNKYQAVE